jgi:hypothetical protein
MQEILKLSVDFFNCRFRKEAGLNGIITAYHTGAMNLEGETFSVKHLGSGEGMCYLGPGTYFSTNEKTARAYEKYRKDATLYECKIDCSKVYDPFAGQPEHYRGILEKMLKETLEELKINKAPYADSFSYGTLEIGQIHKLLGKDKAIEKFKKYGLSGFAQRLDYDCVEICIFDYSAVQIVNKTPLKVVAPEPVKEAKKEKSISLVDNWIRDEKIELGMNGLSEGDYFMDYNGEDHIMNCVYEVVDLNDDYDLTTKIIAASEDFQESIGAKNTIKHSILGMFDSVYWCHFDQSKTP